MKKNKFIEVNLGRIELKDFAEKVNNEKDLNFVNWGDKNLFPSTLLQMLYNSSTHLNIVTKRKNMCLGSGIEIEKKTNKSEAETKLFINSINRFGDSMEDLLEKIFFDYIVFGQASIQVIWGRGFNKIAELYHIPINYLRYNKKSENQQIEKVWYSENWAKFRTKEYAPIPMQMFSTNPEIIKNAPSQIMLLKPYSPGCGYYTNPSYVGGLNYINLSWQMSEFASATMKNGIFPSLIITQRNVSDDEKSFIVNEFEKQYTNQTNASKVIYSFVENMEDIKFDTLDIKGQETMIETLSKLATDNILQAHSMPGILVGIETAGKLGTSNEINDAFLEVQSSVIDPDKNFILKHINKILAINQLDSISITTNTPVPFQGTEDLMQNVLTIDESRELLGYEPLDPSQYGNIVQNVIGGSQPVTPTTIAQAVIKQQKK